jgi:outer membrane protein assembly factor BamA
MAEVETGGQLETRAVPGTTDGQALGLGASLVRDTRSSTVYPRHGAYHQLLIDAFLRVWMGDYRFGRYTLDLRRYVPVGRSHVLALQALGVATSGGPPFDRLPELGGDRLLRGYYQGRYRDRDLIAFQAEYRMPLFWRVGAAGFVGAGQVGDGLGSLALDRFHVAAGAGLRFLLAQDEGLNIRADFAFGEEDSGLYLSLGEAF